MKELTGNWKKHYDYRFLSAEELTRDVTVRIEKVVQEEAFNGREKEAVVVLMFAGKDKGVICNKTNAKTISKIAGSPNFEDWKGVDITLTTQTVSAFGQQVQAIRVKQDISGIKVNS